MMKSVIVRADAFDGGRFTFPSPASAPFEHGEKVVVEVVDASGRAVDRDLAIVESAFPNGPHTVVYRAVLAAKEAS